jgi:hypothetical protein
MSTSTITPRQVKDSFRLEVEACLNEALTEADLHKLVTEVVQNGLKNVTASEFE